MTARRRLALAVCIVALVAAALTAASWLATRLWGPALPRERLESALADVLGGPARVERVAVEPWRGLVTITGVAAAPGTAGSVEALAVGRVQAHIGIASLWHRRVVLRRVIVEDGALVLRPADGPPLAELPLIRSRVRLGAVEVEIRAIELRRADIAYRAFLSGHDRAGAADFAVAARGLDATVRPEARAMDLSLRAEAVDIERAGRRERLSDVEASGQLHPDAIRLARATFT